MTVQTATETDCVRELAREVAEIAASPENEAICRRWRDVNALRKPDRSPVYCRPVAAWSEILSEDELVSEDPWLRSIERQFRMILFKKDVGDDSPVGPNFSVGAVFEREPQNTWGPDVKRNRPGVAGGAWSYDPPLETEADFEKLQLPSFTYNESRTQEALSKFDDLLGDILPVKLTCGPPLGSILCGPAADLRGLMQIMVDMADRPDLMHRLMAHIRDGVLQGMRQAEETGLLTPNNTGPMSCSDPVAPDPPNGKFTYRNLWIMTNSQEYDQVSPAMWKEFLLDYQMPILEQFGLSAYGCCEDLTQKIDGVLSIPNLRIFVCSGWTDLDKVIERVGTDYTIMWRQKATDVVFPDDVESIRRHLDEGMRKLQGCYVQIVLRELQTLAGHPDRLHVWAKLAMEAAARYS
ncbi:MAG: hypothetical protein QF473_32255 [Planctomycetota bacterium]|jgi:hypothetical protein|nr:hypothetical protein [Planctomycetota bacterium]